jgi:hypothetical protein
MPYKNKEDKAANMKKWNEKNKDYRQDYNQDYYAKNPESYKNSYLMRTYGITLQDYNKMFEEQSGCCAICNTHQSEFKQSLSVDHCHATGKVRALLCKFCNTALGMMKDDPELLIKAAGYINEHKA